MKLSTRLSHIIGVILDPNFWVRNYEVSDELSDYIENLIDNNAECEIIHPYIIKLGEAELWVANWPYAYGQVMYGAISFEATCTFLPRRKTALKLRKYIQQKVLQPRAVS